MSDLRSKVPPPWLPAPYSDDVIWAVRAMHAGLANDVQQKLIWQWLMLVSGVDDLSFRPGGPEGDRDTVFAEGKRFVGFQMRKMLSPAVDPKSKRG